MDVSAHWSRTMAEEHGDGSLRVNGAATAGPVVFAALGDEFRLEYTVIGDAVNLAAKLEKHNKVEATSALTTRGTYDLACIQGFSAAEQATQRGGCQVAGVEKPTDLVVIAA